MLRQRRSNMASQSASADSLEQPATDPTGLVALQLTQRCSRLLLACLPLLPLQGLAVLQQYGGQAAAAAGSLLAGLASPFQLFEGAWGLNLLFFGVLGLLAYSLVVLAPRQ